MVDVTVEISTKDRYDFLAQAIQSIALQTVAPKKLIITDDGRFLDLRQSPLFSCLFKVLDRKGIQWEVLKGEGRGQVINHQRVLEKAKTEFIFRLDDDNVLGHNVLERLTKLFEDPKVGAAASCVLHPGREFPPEVTSSSIKDCLFKYAVQFSQFEGIKEVEHLYSTFMYRKSAAQSYPMYLSAVGHREETIFTHQIFRDGYKLLVDGEASTWHFQAPQGGIRTFNNPHLWAEDDKKFKRQLDQWNIRTNRWKLIHLNNGIGDHYMLRSVFERIKTRNPNTLFIIAACYPDVFWDFKEGQVTSITGGEILSNGDVSKYDVYKFCYENNWEKHLSDAFLKMYG